MDEPFLRKSSSSQEPEHHSNPPWSDCFIPQTGLINPTMSNDSPSWLNGTENTSGSSPAPALQPEPELSTSEAAAPPSQIEKEEGVEKAVLLMRVLNMAVAIALMTVSVSLQHHNSLPVTRFRCTRHDHHRHCKSVLTNIFIILSPLSML